MRNDAMQALYFSDSIRKLETAARVTFPGIELMQRAGLAAAQRARELLGESGTNVLVLAGPGNNGGDAFVVARQLRAWFYRVHTVFVGDAAALPADATQALQAFLQDGDNYTAAIPHGVRFDLVIDGLFGTGLRRPLQAPYSELVAQANALGAPILALDVPSGINADNGQVMGSAVRATHTLTFLALKPGLLTLDGPDYRGQLGLDTLGLEAAQLVPPDGLALSAEQLRGVLAPRDKNSHKGTFGSVGIIGGGDGMVGAALLAGRAALNAGAGRVYVGLLAQNRPTVDFLQPELMLRDAASIMKARECTCLVLGPGLGAAAEVYDTLRPVLSFDDPLILDADALTMLAQDMGLQRTIKARRAPTILTPHPAEAARLLSTDTKHVQADRIAAARRIAQQYHAYVVLKGVGSVCATPDQRWYINATGNPGLASAGMGDVLAGFIGALLAQGATAEQALLAGVQLHGLAADMLVARGVGPRGLTASEVILELRELINIQ